MTLRLTDSIALVRLRRPSQNMNLQGLHSATKERFASLRRRRQICRLLTPSFVLTVGCKYIENVCGI